MGTSARLELGKRRAVAPISTPPGGDRRPRQVAVARHRAHRRSRSVARGRGPRAGPPQSSRGSDDVPLLGVLHRESSRTGLPAAVDRGRNGRGTPRARWCRGRTVGAARHAGNRVHALVPARRRQRARRGQRAQHLDHPDGTSVAARLAVGGPDCRDPRRPVAGCDRNAAAARVGRRVASHALERPVATRCALLPFADRRAASTQRRAAGVARAPRRPALGLERDRPRASA